MPRLLFAAALLLSACDSADVVSTPQPAERAPARYVVTLDATWSAATHPEAFPPDPHFSRLTGAAHAEGVRLWEVGEPATDGVREMAELGRTAALRAEADAVPGRLAVPFEGGPVPVSPGVATAEVTVTEGRPLATVVTMIAPSPDWFVGVSGLDLRDGDGWADRRTVALSVYDAGTDDGDSFTAPNAPRAVRQPVAALGYGPLAAPVGTLTFERVE